MGWCGDRWHGRRAPLDWRPPLHAACELPGAARCRRCSSVPCRRAALSGQPSAIRPRSARRWPWHEDGAARFPTHHSGCCSIDQGQDERRQRSPIWHWQRGCRPGRRSCSRAASAAGTQSHGTANRTQCRGRGIQQAGTHPQPAAQPVFAIQQARTNGGGRCSPRGTLPGSPACRRAGWEGQACDRRTGTTQPRLLPNPPPQPAGQVAAGQAAGGLAAAGPRIRRRRRCRASGAGTSCSGRSGGGPGRVWGQRSRRRERGLTGATLWRLGAGHGQAQDRRARGVSFHLHGRIALTRPRSRPPASTPARRMPTYPALSLPILARCMMCPLPCFPCCHAALPRLQRPLASCWRWWHCCASAPASRRRACCGSCRPRCTRRRRSRSGSRGGWVGC